MQDNSSQTTFKNIEIGKFYFIHDGSKTGHPGYIVWKNDDRNRYLAIRFDSDNFGDVPKKDRGVKHITKLKHPTSDKVMNSYVHNRPMLCKRKDIGIFLPNLQLSEDDINIIEDISKKNPELSPSLKHKKTPRLAY